MKKIREFSFSFALAIFLINPASAGFTALQDIVKETTFKADTTFSNTWLNGVSGQRPSGLYWFT